MRRPRSIPDGTPFDQLPQRLDQRRLYVSAFEHYSWYPNCCVQARIELDEADKLRKEMNLADQDPGSRITFNHLINKAVANALRKHIIFNTKRSWRDTYLVYDRINLSNVVDVAGMASMVVIQEADKLTLRQLARVSHKLISARRIDQLNRTDRFDKLRKAVSQVDLLTTVLPYLGRLLYNYSNTFANDLLEPTPGTVSVTNPGTLGAQDCKAMMFFGARVTCLRVMAIEEEAYLEDGQVKFRKVLPIGLDYDQRLIDAGPATRLLNEIRDNLEDPRNRCMGPAQPEGASE